MEQRELHEGICYKLYLFVMKTLTSQAVKTVTLGGRPSHYGSSSTELMITQRGFGTKPDKMVLPEKNIPCRNSIDDGNELRDLSHAAPKKMVSINDKVEEIILPSKKMIKSFQKSNSQDQHQHPNPKPLLSILKVGSNLCEKSNSIC